MLRKWRAKKELQKKKEFKALSIVAIKIQAHFRKQLALRERRRLSSAATLIQNRFRIKTARMSVAEVRQKKMREMMEQLRLTQLAESKRTVDRFLNTASSGLMTEHEKRRLGLPPGISDGCADTDKVKARAQAKEQAAADARVKAEKEAKRSIEARRQLAEKRQQDAADRRSLAPVRASDRAVSNLSAIKASSALQGAGRKAILIARLGMKASDTSKKVPPPVVPHTHV
eukprot:SAG31_NODE_9026_length_1345_cov_8.972299_1_plen_229_part_00